MCHGIDKQRNDLQHLDERARPAVQEQERNRVRIRTADMHEVNPHPADGRVKVLESIESRLLRSPIERVSPVRDELAEIRRIRAVLPPRSWQLVGPTRVRETVVKIDQDGVGHVNREAFRLRPRGRPLCVATFR